MIDTNETDTTDIDMTEIDMVEIDMTVIDTTVTDEGYTLIHGAVGGHRHPRPAERTRGRTRITVVLTTLDDQGETIVHVGTRTHAGEDDELEGVFDTCIQPSKFCRIYVLKTIFAQAI